MQIKVENVSKSLVAGVNFKLSIKDVKNPKSLRPTGTFKDIMFFDSNLKQDLSGYTENITITTTELGVIDKIYSNISQSSYDANADSQVQIYFSPKNPLPSTAAIVVQVPSALKKLYNEPESCYILLAGGINITNTCTFEGRQIFIRNAFKDYNDTEYK